MNGLIEFLERFNVSHQTEGHEHVRSGWVGLDCPDCSPDSNRFRLGINLENLYATCWTCGYKSLSKILTGATGQPYPVIREFLKSWSPLRPVPRHDRPQGPVRLPEGLADLGRAHKTYLKGRGIRASQVARIWGVRGIGIHHRLSWRLFIPIHLGGRIVSWTTRSIGSIGGGLRYISAKPTEEEFPLRDLLYGEDHVRHAAIVVEGPIDAWRIGPGAVATFGLGVSSAQVRRIASFPMRVICFDSEPAAQARAERLCRELAGLPGRTERVELETGADPAEASDVEIRELRAKYLGT